MKLLGLEVNRQTENKLSNGYLSYKRIEKDEHVFTIMKYGLSRGCSSISAVMSPIYCYKTKYIKLDCETFTDWER